MRLLETIRDALAILMGAPMVPLRYRLRPSRSQQKRRFKSGRRRVGRHYRMPPKAFMSRIEIRWQPADPSKLLADVVTMLRTVSP